MSERIECPVLPDRMLQECPLCGQKQAIAFHGLVNNLEGGNPKVCYDKGYSFCNCRNIFFTNPKNLRHDIYDENYYKKYNFKLTRTIAEYEAKKFYRIFKQLNVPTSTFLEIGAIADYVMDIFNGQSTSVESIDISNHPSKYPINIIDFEDYIPSKRYDIIWASHVFEHFIDPIASLRKIKSMLSDNGAIYIAMPDTFFIDFGTIIQWDWNCDEHYILWGMESFIEMANEIGFKCIYSEHGTDMFTMENKGLFWKQDFKVILQCK